MDKVLTNLLIALVVVLIIVIGVMAFACKDCCKRRESITIGYQAVGGIEENDDISIISRDDFVLLTETSCTSLVSRWIGLLHSGENERMPILVSYASAQAKPHQQLIWRNFVGLLLELPEHRNVLKSLGICYDDDLIYVVHPYKDIITLRSYLKREVRCIVSTNTRFTSLLTAAYDVVSGLEFLNANKCCHPGLCVVRILVDVYDTCKLYDFCKQEDAIDTLEQFNLNEDSDVRTSLPPESIFLGEYTSASDVWSIGVTLWEIFSYGVAAYPNVSLSEYEKRLRENERLQKPVGLPDELYEVVESCWTQTSSRRPTITSLVEKLRTVSSRILKQINDGRITINDHIPSDDTVTTQDFLYEIDIDDTTYHYRKTDGSVGSDANIYLKRAPTINQLTRYVSNHLQLPINTSLTFTQISITKDSFIQPRG
ncbi:ibroblast growth factor receptor 1 (fms-related tyrosine kinase 2, Pfeiffer syndrome) [Apostichopus japonicus]|uniref:Ibroblast growth factor receptor 1 (Fms-related tyrosine kinase 2, Pfeiffer syndrome) n=1 Tax=Stichopus japonicus TaxID=307972 RepID=A0A2G8KHR8_STIJA|nr:ibroblast growth factor receptor 1 (fms-related tyrosine kinase 2, Pfeiffer syndrome) [Apostichopus japonicus]